MRSACAQDSRGGAQPLEGRAPTAGTGRPDAEADRGVRRLNTVILLHAIHGATHSWGRDAHGLPALPHRQQGTGTAVGGACLAASPEFVTRSPLPCIRRLLTALCFTPCRSSACRAAKSGSEMQRVHEASWQKGERARCADGTAYAACPQRRASFRAASLPLVELHHVASQPSPTGQEGCCVCG